MKESTGLTVTELTGGLRSRLGPEMAVRSELERLKKRVGGENKETK